MGRQLAVYSFDWLKSLTAFQAYLQTPLPYLPHLLCGDPHVATTSPNFGENRLTEF
jgi:hypothetical protein